MIFCSLACAHLFWSSFPEGQHGFCHPEACFPVGPPPPVPILPPVFPLCLFQVLLLSLCGFCSLFLKCFSTSQFHAARAFSPQFPVLRWIHSKEWGVFPLFPKFVIAQWMNSVSMIFPVELGQLRASYHFLDAGVKHFVDYFITSQFVFYLLLPDILSWSIILGIVVISSFALALG